MTDKTDFQRAVRVACAIRNRTLTDVLESSGRSRPWFYNCSPTLAKVDEVAQELNMKTSELIQLGEQ